MAEATAERNLRRTMVGQVVSDKMDKTRRVDVSRLQKHPKYGKFLKRRTVCYIHDPENTAKLGDTVEIAECRPMSKLKRWRLVRVISSPGALGDVAEDVVDETAEVTGGALPSADDGQIATEATGHADATAKGS